MKVVNRYKNIKGLLLAVMLVMSGVVKSATYTANDVNSVSGLNDALYKSNFAGYDAIVINITGDIVINSQLSDIGSASGPVTINGGGKTITASGTGFRCFYLGSGANATINNVTITGFDIVADGGAINNTNGGNLVLDNVTFMDNTCNQWRGGAIYSNGGSLTFKNAVTFSNNKGKNVGAFNGAGGALFLEGAAIMTVDGGSVNFTNNTATWYGGAIALAGTSSIFIKGGGRITYSGNTDGGYGGNNCYFSSVSNTYTVEVNATTGVGAGSLKDAIEVASSITNPGNPIYIKFADAIKNAADPTVRLSAALNANVNDAKFIIDGENKVILKPTATGFRCLNIGFYTNTTLKGLTIDGFQNGDNGGAVLCEGPLTLDNVTLQNNKSTAGAWGGGAIYGSQLCNLNLNNSVNFIDNTTVANGGAIVLLSGAQMTVNTGAQVASSGNQAVNGNAIFIDGSAGTITNSGTITVEALTDIAGKSITGTGQIVVAGAANPYLVTAANTLEMAIARAYEADAIGTDVTITFDEGISSVNVSQSIALAARTGKLTIDGGSGVTIQNSGTGHNCFNVASGVNLFLNNLTIKDFDNGSNAGAAINNSGSNLTLTNVTFSGNKTTGNGGAIFSQDGTVSLNGNVTFSGNNAGYYGGAICLEGTAVLTAEQGSTTGFTGNTGEFGGDISTNLYTKVNIRNGSVFSVSTLSFYGGGTLANGNLIQNNTLLVNSVVAGTGNGYSVVTLADAINIANMELDMPITVKFANGIGIRTNPVKVSSEMVITRKADKTLTIDGGTGVIIQSSGTGFRCFNKTSTLTLYADLVLKNLTFDGFNYDAAAGGVIYNNNGYMTLDNVKFTNNNAGWGVFWTDYGFINIRNNLVFENNTAAYVLGSFWATNVNMPDPSKVGKISFSGNSGDLWNTKPAGEDEKDRAYETFIKPQINPTPRTYIVTINSDDNTEGTLQKAISLANTFTIDTILFAGPMTIATTGYEAIKNNRGKNLVIDGACGVIIKAKQSGFRAFWNNVAGSDSLIIKGVTIRDFNTSGQGAAIFNSGGCNLVLDNVNFINNDYTGDVVGAAGGAISTGTGAIMTFRNRVYFEDNQSTKVFGGAIFLYYARLIIGSDAQAIFLNNSSANGGGAIYSWEYFTTEDPTLYKITPRTDGGKSLIFTGNSVTKTAPYGTDLQAAPAGGAILHSGKSIIELKSAVFNSNIAYTGGGFAAASDGNTGATVKLYDCTFSGNQAIDNRPGIAIENNGGGGGAINKKGPLFMDNKCIFTNNTATGNGGAIYYYNKPADGAAVAPLKIRGTFRNNVAGHAGGAILADLQNNSPGVEVYGNYMDTTFVYEKNHAKFGNGGFIAVHHAPVKVFGWYKGSGTETDPFVPKSTDPLKQQAYFRENIAGYAGGAIYSFNGDTVRIENARFYYNKQEDTEDGYEKFGGGAIAFHGSQDETTIKPTVLKLKDARFEYNSATKGGAIAGLSTIDTIRVIDEPTDATRFFANKAYWQNQNQSDVVLGYGGAIYSMGPLVFEMPNATPTREDVTADPANEVLKAQFHDNFAQTFGGAIYSQNNLVLDNNYFHQNRANGGGGAVYLDLNPKDGEVEAQTGLIENSLFMINSSGFGGAVKLEHLVRKDNGTPDDPNDDTLVPEPTGTLVTIGSTFYQNRASSGGAVHAVLPTLVDAKNNMFEENMAIGGDTPDPVSGDSYGKGGAIYSQKGYFHVGDNVFSDFDNKILTDPDGIGNTFKNNYACFGNATGAAVYTTGQVDIHNNLFEGNLAGNGVKNGETWNVTPGAVITVGCEDLDIHERIFDNQVLNNKGTMPDLYPLESGPRVFDVNSHGIGFNNEAGTTPIGNLTINNNVIQGNNYGVFVPAYVKGVKITQNTFGKNTESIHNLQHAPRVAASDTYLSSKGNLGIGMPMLLFGVKKVGDQLQFAFLPTQNLVNEGDLIEFYKADKPLDKDATEITYLGVANATDIVTSTCASANYTFTLPNGTTFGDTDALYLLSIDKDWNTSEFSITGVPLQINITDAANSNVDFSNANFIGNWSADSPAFQGGDETTFAVYPGTGCDIFQPVTTGSGEPKKWKGAVYVIPDATNQWQVAVQTGGSDGNKRFGSWSFDGLYGDTINMETYRVVQNYTFTTNTPANGFTNDYKLLAVVDGSNENHFRNNKYLSVGNLAGNNSFNGGGGGLIIKNRTGKTDDGTVYFTKDSLPVGGSLGTLTAGFIVVDSIADFIIDGANAQLAMNSTNGGTGTGAFSYGPRLILEKGVNSSAIFALDNGGVLNSGSNFMAAYHHKMRVNEFSWLGHPEGVSFRSAALTGGPVKDDKILFTTSSLDNQFISYLTGNYTAIQIQNYGEATRATTKPSFTDGTAWERDATNASGFIATAYKPTTPDLYLRINNPQSIFTNGDKTVSLSFTTCTREDQYKAAAQYLGKLIPWQFPTGDEDIDGLVAAYHSGWNLIGNPFSKSYEPSLSMGVLAIQNANGDGYIYRNLSDVVVDSSGETGNGAFPGTDSDTPFRVPPLASFFIQAPYSKDNQSYKIDFNLHGGKSLDNEILRSSQSKPGIVRVDLMKGDLRIGQTVLSFVEGATPVMNRGLDVPLMSNRDNEIYLVDSLGIAMVINVVGTKSAHLAVPVGLKISASGVYNLRISEISNVEADSLLLKDGENEVLIKEGDIYPFTIQNGTSRSRFALVMKNSISIPDPDDQGGNPDDGDDDGNDDDYTGMDSMSGSSPSVFVADRAITVQNLSGQSTIILYDIAGRLLYKKRTNNENTCVIPKQKTGNYIVMIQQNKQQYRYKVIVH